VARQPTEDGRAVGLEGRRRAVDPAPGIAADDAVTRMDARDIRANINDTPAMSLAGTSGNGGSAPRRFAMIRLSR
jgi:hypothetical protein